MEKKTDYMQEKKKNKPVMKFISGTVGVNVWENMSDKGIEFHSYSIQANYKDEQGNWHDKTSLNYNELLRLRACIDKALFEKILVLTK